MTDTTPSPLVAGEVEALVKRLRDDASEIAGWGAGNEAANVRAAADMIESLAAPAQPDGWRGMEEYAYDELWQAIADATRIEGGIIAISVVKFREAIRAIDAAAPSASGKGEG